MYNYLKKIIIWLLTFIILWVNISSTFAVRDIMDVMFQPAKWYEKIIDLGSTKNAVGNEVFRESTNAWINFNLSNVCMVWWKIIAEDLWNSKFSNWVEWELFNKTLDEYKQEVWYKWSNEDFCQIILWWTYETKSFTWDAKTQAPLIVRITKFLLRLTIVLAITMVLYNGIFWVIESAKWGDVKDAKNNIIYIFGGILLALSSVALINLVSSITLSSLNPDDIPQKDDSIVNTSSNRSRSSWWWGGSFENNSYDNINNDIWKWWETQLQMVIQ